ncbi:MAG: redoxin domain-containing protein [Alphaproteobacteria bacterium]|nr:redoxin domain-containing protein [Alphaproteobacteria bacterium]
MDVTFIGFVLAFLAFAIAINSFLIIRTAKMIEAIAPAIGMPSPLCEGTPLPAFSGSMIQTGETVCNASLVGKPGVIIFMTSGCAVCEEKKPEILRARQGAKALGVIFLVAEMDSLHAAQQDLSRTSFLSFTMTLNKKSFYRLNPTKSMPLYVFFDENGIVKASNLIGDENWTLFIEKVTAVTLPGDDSNRPTEFSDTVFSGAV